MKSGREKKTDFEIGDPVVWRSPSIQSGLIFGHVTYIDHSRMIGTYVAAETLDGEHSLGTSSPKEIGMTPASIFASHELEYMRSNATV